MTDALIVGAPSVLAAWVHALVREAAALLDPPVEIRMLERQDNAEFLGTGDSGPARLFLSNFPSASLVAKVASGAVPTLALLDEPTDSLRFLKLHTNLPMMEVLRVQTLAHTIDRALYDNSSVLILHRGMDIGASEIIDIILETLRFHLSAETLAALKERHTGKGSAERLEDLLRANVPEWKPIDDLRNLLSEEEADLAAKVLAPLLHFGFEAKPPQVVWPQKVFLFADKRGEPLPLVLDVTGGARIILFGPYLFLPPGRYRVSFVVGFSDETRGMPFLIKAVQHSGQTIIAQARWTAPAGGIFEGAFELFHALSNEAIEIVLINEEGAIEGRMALVQVAFDLLGDEDREDFSAVLLSPVIT